LKFLYLSKSFIRPGGGDIKIENRKLKWEVKSKISTLFEKNPEREDSLEQIMMMRQPVKVNIYLNLQFFKSKLIIKKKKIKSEKLNWNYVHSKINKDYQERALYTPMDDAGQTISFAVIIIIKMKNNYYSKSIYN
jgi:hypothetical protein